MEYRCPSKRELLDYHLGRLPEAELNQTATHLETCDVCNDALARLETQDDGLLAALRDQPTLERIPSVDPVGESETSIGPYHLVRLIGEGGMGVVYLAEQHQPVKRRVALKLIKPGLSSRRVIARFEAERQALALMDHPNVARIFDAGVTASGRPYFVMEFLDGEPITRFCDGARLTTDQRAELFISVCRAVQHAHQKGILHRDIKPSNVLVSLVDGKPVAKVIDFGVAKALDTPLGGEERFTQVDTILGTIEYMSPEQAAGGRSDLDTRSDVYSLGVLLYELLTGSPPIGDARLREAALGEILRRIQEDEPPKPSTRLDSSIDQIASIAAARSAEPRRLVRAVRGDLDWVVMRALEKNRTRRYDSAGRLADEVERFLSGFPVEAGPPDAGYRLKKFAWKHWPALAVGIGFVSLLAVSTVVSLVLMLLARNAERLATSRGDALHAANEATSIALADTRKAQSETQAALERSEDSRRQADAVSEFLSETLRSPDPALDGRSIRVASLLDRAANSLGHSFENDAILRGRLLNELAMTYQGLGLYDRAIESATRARSIRESALGSAHPDTLSTCNTLARAYKGAGRIDEALELVHRTLAAAEERLGADHGVTLTARDHLASLEIDRGRFEDARSLHERNSRLAEARLGRSHRTSLLAQYGLARATLALKRTEEAIQILESILPIAEESLGIDHPITLLIRFQLAQAYSAADRQAEAAATHERNLHLSELRLGPDHPETESSRHALASVYHEQGRIAESIAMQERLLRDRSARLAPDHPNLLATRNNLAAAYTTAGRADDGVKLHEQTVALCDAKFGSADHRTLIARSVLAVAYLAAGRNREAIAQTRSIHAARSRTLDPNHPSTLGTASNLATILEVSGRWPEAEQLRRDTADRYRSAGPLHPLLEAELVLLARNLLHQEQPDAARPIAAEVITLCETAAPSSWARYEAMSLLAIFEKNRGNFAPAERLAVDGYEGLAQRQTQLPTLLKTLLPEAAYRTIALYDSWGRHNDAAAWRERLRLPDLPPNVFAPDDRSDADVETTEK